MFPSLQDLHYEFLFVQDDRLMKQGQKHSYRSIKSATEYGFEPFKQVPAPQLGQSGPQELERRLKGIESGEDQVSFKILMNFSGEKRSHMSEMVYFLFDLKSAQYPWRSTCATIREQINVNRAFDGQFDHSLECSE
jgi:hypothetical protein